MSQRHQIQENTKNVLGLAPVDSTGAANNGAGIDTLAHANFGEVLTLITVGSASGTPDSFSVAAKIQQSSDDGSGDAYADVSGLTMTAITTNNGVGEIHFDKGELTERYFRVVVTPTFAGGTSPKIELSATHTLNGFVQVPQA